MYACVCVCTCVLQACFCKSLASPYVCVVIDDPKSAHIISKAFARCVSQELSSPLSLPKQRPRLLIYSKSLKSAYYCSSSSPALLPQSLYPRPSPTKQKDSFSDQRRLTVSRIWHLKFLDEYLDENKHFRILLYSLKCTFDKKIITIFPFLNSNLVVYELHVDTMRHLRWGGG